jgi:hypothetical protein
MQLFQSVQILQLLKTALPQQRLLLRQSLHQLPLLLHLLLLLHQLRPLPLHRLHLLRLLQVEQLLQCLHSAKASAKELLLAGLRMWAIALQ